MAGTWLDFRQAGTLYGRCIDAHSERKTDGGRHWTRTSDLLHVKQVRGEIGAGLTSEKVARPDFSRSDGWTLAGFQA